MNAIAAAAASMSVYINVVVAPQQQQQLGVYCTLQSHTQPEEPVSKQPLNSRPPSFMNENSRSSHERATDGRQQRDDAALLLIRPANVRCIAKALLLNVSTICAELY